MIVSQTPLRISFVGGGSDMKEYWELSPGAVISTTIDKYIYVIIKSRFDNDIYLNYSKKEIVKSIDEIQHHLIREAMKKTGVLDGVEITTLADIPSEGSGLGSSSSVLVGLLNALYAYKGIQVTAEKLAIEACEIEIDILKRPIGKQDQYASAFGGLNKIVFNTDNTVSVKKIGIKNGEIRQFGSNLLLFYTGLTRQSSQILSDQILNLASNKNILDDMVKLVNKFEEQLYIQSNSNLLGELLNTNWEYKKELSGKISNDIIEKMYSTALNSGACGGKISGAGGGGFLLLYIPREKQNLVREMLNNYREFPFMFVPDGSKIIFNIQRDYWR